MRQNASAASIVAAFRNLPLEYNLFLLQKSPLPKLQAEQGEYLFGVVAAVRVSLQQALDAILAEIAAIDGSAVHQHVPNHILEIGPQPGLVGDGKSGLLPVADFFGNSLGQAFFRIYFVVDPLSLIAGRQRRGKLQTLWSSSGTRSSMELAMVILSALISRSSGSQVLVSI